MPKTEFTRSHQRLAKAVGAALLWATLSGCGMLGTGKLTVGDLLASASELHPVEATAELCGDPTCVEGWRTDAGSYLRFDSVGQAELWATVLGDDGRRWENFVLDMRDKELTFAQRRYAIEVLYSYHDWG